MSRRRELQSSLEELLGSRNVYFQPPPSLMLSYPCYIYNRVSYDPVYADNKTYLLHEHYRLLYVDPYPDSDQVLKTLNAFEMIRHSSSYTSENLNHDAFDLYY